MTGCRTFLLDFVINDLLAYFFMLIVMMGFKGIIRPKGGDFHYCLLKALPDEKGNKSPLDISSCSANLIAISRTYFEAAGFRMPNAQFPNFPLNYWSMLRPAKEVCDGHHGQYFSKRH